jgi:hypothetical protein
MTGRYRSLWRWLAAALFAGHAAAAAPPGGDGTRQVGPFAISAHGKSVGNSALFLRTGNPFGSQSMREYEVRWNGRPVELPVIGKRFWQVLHLPDAPQPALLVANGPRLHLVTENGGRLEVHPLAPESGSAALQWLDSADGQPAPPLGAMARDRADATPRTTLAGGRWLYLNNRLLLDVHTLTRVPVEPWLDQGQGEKLISMNASNSPAMALSPGRTRFVLRGQGQDQARGGERFEMLMLIDMATGKPTALRLDRERTPYAEPAAIDAAWIATHLQWSRGPDGRERLQPR